jgi:hypothetical protein
MARAAAGIEEHKRLTFFRRLHQSCFKNLSNDLEI